MNLDSNVYHRRSIRLPSYDYSLPGAYFVTICTHKHEPLFGSVAAGEMRLNAFGKIVVNIWNEIPDHFDCIQLGEFCVMPNHIHEILIIVDRRGKACLAPTSTTNNDKNQYQKPKPGS